MFDDMIYSGIMNYQYQATLYSELLFLFVQVISQIPQYIFGLFTPGLILAFLKIRRQLVERFIS